MGVLAVAAALRVAEEVLGSAMVVVEWEEQGGGFAVAQRPAAAEARACLLWLQHPKRDSDEHHLPELAINWRELLSTSAMVSSRIHDARRAAGGLRFQLPPQLLQE